MTTVKKGIGVDCGKALAPPFFVVFLIFSFLGCADVPSTEEAPMTEDLAPVVDDAVVVPVNPDEFVRSLLVFEGAESGRRYGRNLIVEFAIGENSLRVITFYGNGTVRDEEVELNRSGITDIRIMDDGDIMVFFDAGGVALVGRDKSRTVFLGLPAGTESVKVNPASGYLYYLLKGDLFALPISGLENGADEGSVPAASGVNAFVIAQNDDIIFLKGGVPYRADYKGEEMAEVADMIGAEAEFINLGVRNGRDYGALILRDNNQKRYLRITDGINNILSLEDDLKGDVFFAPSDRLLYADGTGKIYIYDSDQGKRMISVRADDFEILGWFSGDNHYLTKEGGQILLNGIEGSEAGVVLKNAEEEVPFWLAEKALFFVEDGVLSVLDWVNVR